MAVCLVIAASAWGVPPSSAQETNTFDKKVQEFGKLVDDWLKFFTAEQIAALKDDQRAKLSNALAAKLDALASLERLDRLSAVGTEAKRLTETLNDIASNDARTAAIIKDLNRVDAAATNRDELLKAVDSRRGVQVFVAMSNLKAAMAALAPKRLRINIVGAWYGDIELIGQALYEEGVKEWQGGTRFCSATAALRAYCESRTECFHLVAGDEVGKKSPAGSAADVSGGTLCGFDPAPYADVEAKGLVVVYQCLNVDDDTWREQREATPHTIDWGARPPRSFKVDPKDWKYSGGYQPPAGKRPPGVFGTILRNGATGEIRCYKDVP